MLGPKTYFAERDPGRIREFADRIRGCKLSKVVSLAISRPHAESHLKGAGKGGIGLIIEDYFGLVHGPSPDPDFKAAGIELKTVPIKRSSRGPRVKERTVLSIINYERLALESWPTATIRKKLDAVMFVYVQTAEPLEFATVLGSEIWSPTQDEGRVLERDWTVARDLVAAGRARELHEGLFEVLSACRKGQGHGRDSRRGAAGEGATPQRAFSLKSSFTGQRFAGWLRPGAFVSIADKLAVTNRADPVNGLIEGVIDKLRGIEGDTLGEVADKFGVPGPSSKHFASLVTRSAIGITDGSARLREFEQYGLTVRTLFMNSRTGSPFEAVSFPVVDLRELVDQSWDDSALVTQVGHILFMPTWAISREASPRNRVVGRPFAWTPSAEEWSTMRSEWERYRKAVADGAAADTPSASPVRHENRLPKEHETEILHMRPHGKNAADTYLDPQGNLVTKRCFWLNKKFLASLVAAQSYDPRRTQ